MFSLDWRLGSWQTIHSAMCIPAGQWVASLVTTAVELVNVIYVFELVMLFNYAIYVFLITLLLNLYYIYIYLKYNWRLFVITYACIIFQTTLNTNIHTCIHIYKHIYSFVNTVIFTR